jgi:Mg/Co/Ni transporter MgtE
MSLRIMMMINTVIAGIFGVGFVLIPWQVQVVYGIQPTPALNYVSELFGAALISLAVLSWSAKDLVESDVRRAIVRALFLGDAIGFVLALFGQLSLYTCFWLSASVLFILENLLRRNQKNN